MEPSTAIVGIIIAALVSWALVQFAFGAVKIVIWWHCREPKTPTGITVRDKGDKVAMFVLLPGLREPCRLVLDPFEAERLSRDLKEASVAAKHRAEDQDSPRLQILDGGSR